MMLFVIMFSMILGILFYCSTREHLLSTLLSLEFMVLMVFICFFSSLTSFNYFYGLIYLIMTACEGALGLSLLVIMGRSHGGDYFKSFDFLYI